MIQTSQVHLMAIGVENYQFMRPLHGPHKDIETFVNLMVQPSNIGLYNPSQLTTLFNPDSYTLRTSINDYVINRSALGDVLIFYFSGHGILVGDNDFGFCTIDARIHDNTDTILPLSILRFRDLIDSLRVMNITPVIIIDACYSGRVGHAINFPSMDIIKIMHQGVRSQNASNYALFCSCSNRQLALEKNNGGIFSQLFFNILAMGIESLKKENFLCLQHIFPELQKRIQSEIADSTPQLFLGDTIPSIPIVHNACHVQQRYRFTKYMAEIIIFLWNDGKERELSIREISSNVGQGAYGNHRKLSYSGWGLLEDNPNNGKRRLTEKGRIFAQGKIRIPDEVIYDPETNNFITSPDSNFIDISSFI